MGVAFEMTRVALRIVDADDGAYHRLSPSGVSGTCRGADKALRLGATI